jgi:aminoglycoside phosphotransferase (APT) family kinase protein
MLQPGDAALVERDSGIPALATLLDPEALCALVQSEAPGHNINRTTPCYVRYKPGTSCIIGFTVESEGRAYHAYARAWRSDARDKLNNAAKRESVQSALGPGFIILPDLFTSLHFLPNDHELTALPLLLDTGERDLMLRLALPTRRDVLGKPVDILRYKPERRLVARVMTGADRGLVIRCYDDAGYNSAQAAANALVNPDAPMARPLAAIDRRRILIWDWEPGTVPHDPPGLLDAIPACAAALTRLHASAHSGLAEYSSADLRSDFTDAAGDLTTLDQCAGVAGQQLARELSPLLDDTCDYCPIHNDFSPDQVVLGPDGEATIIDLDRAAHGPRACDLGTFLAALQIAALEGRLAEGECTTGSEAFLDAYQHASGRPLPHSIGAFTAAALLRRAAEPFRLRYAEWPHATRQIVARAQEAARCSVR